MHRGRGLNMNNRHPSGLAPVQTKDYARQYQAIYPEIEAALRRCLLEDRPVLGAAVERFEQALATWHAVDYAVGTGSGTDAACLIYRALGIGAGDEVITNGHTFAGVISAIVLAGAQPVLVDCDEATGRLDPAAIEAAIGPRTRAVMAVHLYGHPEAVDTLSEICTRRGITLLEDAAQAHGARWRKCIVGAWGQATVLSFHPSKNLGAYGDAGAVLTNDAALASQIRLLRNLGKAGKYCFDAVGPNAKLDTLQAAILEIKLRHLDAYTQRRRGLAKRYLDGLQAPPCPPIRLPSVHPDAEPVWHLFVIRAADRRDRDALAAWLKAQGIASGLHYPIPAHLQPGLAPFLGSISLPNAEAWAASVLTLPLSHEHTEPEMDRVVAAVRAWGAQ